MVKRFVSISGGATATVDLPFEVIKKYPNDEIVLVMAIIKNEHPDTWRMIEWLKTQDCTFYDLGGISPETNPGVYRFKNRLTGKNGKEVFHIGQYSICKNRISSFTINMIEHLRKIVSKFK